MDMINASNLRAAVTLSAAVIVSDGRWDKWQKLITKALEDRGALIGKWTWSEDDTHYIASFSCGRRLPVELRFVDSGSGNNYQLAELRMDGQAVKPLPKNGNELIDRVYPSRWNMSDLKALAKRWGNKKSHVKGEELYITYEVSRMDYKATWTPPAKDILDEFANNVNSNMVELYSNLLVRFKIGAKGNVAKNQIGYLADLAGLYK